MQQLIKLKDFYAAAYLIVKLGSNSLYNHYREGGSTTFEFYNSDELQKYLDDLYNLKATVEPISYSSAIRNLKTLIHNGRAIEHYLSTNSTSGELNNGFNNKSTGTK